LKNIAGTGVSAKLETGHEDDMGWRSREGGDIGRDFLHPNDFGGPEYGRIILTFSDLPAGTYSLTSFHNKIEEPPYVYRGIPISKVNIAISGSVSASEGAIGVIQTEVYEHTDEGIGTGVVTFTATGKGDVVVEFAPDGSAMDGTRNLGDRAWLNGFVLEKPVKAGSPEEEEKKLVRRDTTSPMASRARGTDPEFLKLTGTKKLVSSGWKGSWSPEGTQLVFARTQRRGLQILDLESGTITDLTSSGKDPVWSPDGQFIAYVDEQSFNAYLSEEVWLVKSTGGTTRKLVVGGFPNWSADGKTLFVQSRKETEILAIDVNDLDAEPKVFFDGPQSWYPTVSPNGKQIAFGRKGTLVIVDRETGKTILEWPTPGSRGLLPAWSPDGNRIAFGGFEGNPLGLWVLDVRTEEAVQVAKGHYTMPAWSKDGTKLAFDHRWRNTREIWIVETESLARLEPSRGVELLQRYGAKEGISLQDRFENAKLISSGTWVEGSFLYRTDEEWFAINVGQNKSYLIYYDDEFGTGKYSADIETYLYKQIFDDLESKHYLLTDRHNVYHQPIKFTSDYTGKLYLRLISDNPQNTTFAVKYETEE
jgi:dipeptidyl aminopeptidase/acylaminoacyl peptidase